MGSSPTPRGDGGAARINWNRRPACGKYGPDGERVTYERGVEVTTWGRRGAKCEVTDCDSLATVLERGPENNRYGHRWQDRYWLCRPCFEARAKDTYGGSWVQRHAESRLGEGGGE